MITTSLIIWLILASNLDPVLFPATTIVTGHAKETWMSPSTESFGHYLFKVETNEQEPETVDKKHGQSVAHCPVVILTVQVFGSRTNLTCLKLRHYTDCLNHSYRWGETGPEAVIIPCIFVRNEVLEHG